MCQFPVDDPWDLLDKHKLEVHIGACVCESLLLRNFDFDIYIMVSIAKAIQAWDAFSSQFDLMVCLNAWRNLQETHFLF